jgi:ribosomal protein RSM22 (predicted rRNA methylase)
MHLPDSLQQAIQVEIERFGGKEIAEARKELTDRYRAHQRQHLMTKEEHRLSYLATRLPATFAVVQHVLEEVKARVPHVDIKSLLDLGAGPGTVMWAAADVFAHLEQVTLIERDMQLMQMGQRLAAASSNKSVIQAQWQAGDLEQLPSLTKSDLITLSYAVGELSTLATVQLIEAAWSATNHLLVIIEPGTPQGFERIRAIRRQLIDLQAYMVAPCPHVNACPMQEGDWCHFAQRIERSALHRRLKEASMGYEDEKYSYVAVCKSPAVLPQTRVLRTPMRRSGHMNLTLCTPDGLKLETISKKQGELYKLARKTEWGSPFPPEVC